MRNGGSTTARSGGQHAVEQSLLGGHSVARVGAVAEDGRFLAVQQRGGLTPSATLAVVASTVCASPESARAGLTHRSQGTPCSISWRNFWRLVSFGFFTDKGSLSPSCFMAGRLCCPASHYP